MARAAPSAMFGELAWAASPMSTTRPRAHAGSTSSIGAKNTSAGWESAEHPSDGVGELGEHTPEELNPTAGRLH